MVGPQYACTPAAVASAALDVRNRRRVILLMRVPFGEGR
jgi:hypothetical protein